ncbi:hypothetical protein PQQ53_27080, partial [Paraburkholderia strydomiana]|uniref:hypothetical protein n=1 Tax=Paraburkholderia strydomiana TaxID=1245417 RepID=UPI0038BDF70A
MTQEKRLRGGFAALWLLRLRRLTDALSRTVASDALGKRHERQIVGSGVIRARPDDLVVDA